MCIADLDDVAKVEAESYTEPWPKDIFYSEIVKNEHAHYFVVEKNGEVIAFSGMWMVLDDAQVTNIAVAPQYRGNKIGERLFAHMCQKAIYLGVKRLSLEVRASNIIAQKMYRKFGLVPGGIRKKYYTDNHEDAIVMWVNFRS